MPSSDRRLNEEGAALILVLIFIGVISLLVTVLASLAANNVRDTSVLRAARSVEYTADAATDAAIQNVRYKASWYPTVGLCTPGAPGATSVSANNSTTIEVYCTGTTNPSSAATRVITFRACPAGQSASACMATPILEAKVTFDDYPSGGLFACTTTVTATCGVGMTINSWVVYSANNSIVVNAGPFVATTSLAAGTQGQSYAQTLTSSGGTSPITWSIQTGTLPTGLSLAPATGVISGTVANTASSQTFTVAATDTTGAVGTASLTITITSAPAAPVFVSDTPPTAGMVGSAYSYSFAASGTPAPTFSVASGSLPAGLTLDTITGVLSGTPTAAGPFTFTVRATNSLGSATSPTITITVSSTPVFTADTPPAATAGVAFSYSFAASGTPAPTFSVASGNLPPGLTLNTTTGVLSGTSTTAGPFTFTLLASNTSGSTASPPITITVTAGPATKFVFTSGAVSGIASGAATLGPITVQEQDAYGNPVTATAGGMTVNLTSTSTGNRFSATAGGAAITSIAILNGNTSVNFFYGDTRAGSPTITAAGSLTSATQPETIASGPPDHLQLANCTQSAPTGNVTCAGSFSLGGKNKKLTANVQALDQFGNPAAIGAPLTLTVSSADTTNYPVTSGSTLTIDGSATPSNQSTTQFTVTHQSTGGNATSIRVHAGGTIPDLTFMVTP